MASTGNTASLPYHEPGIVDILIVSSFVLLLNAVNYILDRIVYCGLVGQLFIGIAWGTPGAKWLSEELQRAIVQLGYIGLILIVFEGGLSSNLQALRANLLLSSVVALTGIAAPVALSFVLTALLPISAVQAFAAGAALCSTSLGTTFTVLSTSGLTESRLGTVLSSAAMIDDVVGLVMIQIIPELSAGSKVTDVTVIRPVFVSIAFAVLIPVICLYVAKPVLQYVCGYLDRPGNARYLPLFRSEMAALVYQTGVLLAMVTGASYAGTSDLFAAYLAGTSVTWLDASMASHPSERLSSAGCVTGSSARAVGGRELDGPDSAAARAPNGDSQSNVTLNMRNHIDADRFSAEKTFEKYYLPAVNTILRPFFFASIGFAIPITKMFSGHIVWRGLVYAVLMISGKMVCGLWLVRFAPLPRAKDISKMLPSIKISTFGFLRASSRRRSGAAAETSAHNGSTLTPHRHLQIRQPNNASAQDARDVKLVAIKGNTPNTSRRRTALPRPKSLYPAAILGSAMVSRGEIGFLISSIAESSGVFGESENTEEFLVVTWAILLCTLIGPIAVGLLVERVRRLQQVERSRANGQEDPLGIWGVLPSGVAS